MENRVPHSVSAVTAEADLVALHGRPSEDAGSETLARYEYQVMLTALECVRCLVATGTVEIVCEWWEDFVILGATGAELVSVKHVEPSQSVWTLARLVDDGGLRHLFDRWRSAGQANRCRLLTNGGLKTGSGEAAAVQRATHGIGRDAVAEDLCGRLGASSRDEVSKFLSFLTIEAELPKRDDLLPKLLVEVLPPLAADLRWPPEEIATRFTAICDEVRRASASDIRAAERALGGGADALARARAHKTISADRLRNALSGAAPSPTSRLVRKLRAGDFGPTDVEKCKRLRSDWLANAYEYRVGILGESEPEAVVRRRVQDLAIEAERVARQSGQPYGARMREELKVLLERNPIEFGDAEVSTDLLLGAAYDETDRCHIWWSEHEALA